MFVYEKRLGFPPELEIPLKVFTLGYSKHASKRRKERIRGKAPSEVKVKFSNILQITTEDNLHITTLVVRTQLNKKEDLFLVIAPRKKQATVVTLWKEKKKTYKYKKKKHATKRLPR